MYLFTLCFACLTVSVNCLVKQFAMCLGVVAIFLLNVMEVFSVDGGALLDIPCIYTTHAQHAHSLEDFQKMCVLGMCPSVYLSVPSIGFVCRKLSPNLRV